MPATTKPVRVEPICRVLTEHDSKIAPSAYYEPLRDGDHSRGRGRSGRKCQGYARLAVRAIREGDRDATNRYTEQAVLTLMAAYAKESIATQDPRLCIAGTKGVL